MAAKTSKNIGKTTETELHSTFNKHQQHQKQQKHQEMLIFEMNKPKKMLFIKCNTFLYMSKL